MKVPSGVPLPPHVTAAAAWGTLLLVVLSLIFPASAQADDLSGTWSASPLRVSWAVGDWGKGCGPRPSGGAESGGTVQITSTGSMGFRLEGLGRTYSSGQCWEQMPGLSPRGKSLSATTIQTTCRMPTGDPRQAKVVTSWYPRGDEIYFDETGQYQFVVSGSNCTASVRRTRVLTRVVKKAAPEESEPKDPREGDTDPQKAAAEKKAERPPEPARASRCAKPGAPVRVEVTPRSKLMTPGESFTFEAVARDARGCRVPIRTEWSLQSGQGVKLSNDGRLLIENSATPGQVSLLATVGQHSVKVSARIVTEDEYESLIAGGQYGALGESLDAATVELSSAHVEFEQSEATKKSSKRATWWGFLAILLALLVGFALFMMRRRSDQTSIPASRRLIDSAPSGDQQGTRPTPSDMVQDRSSDTEHTERDLSMAETVATPTPAAPAQASKKRLCPVCGRKYEDDTTYCGEDGARLMRMN